MLNLVGSVKCFLIGIGRYYVGSLLLNNYGLT